MAQNMKLSGWRRQNGRIGVRNHVVMLPLDDLSNAVCEAVANNIKGTLALPHAYGRLQFGADLDLFFRTLIGTGSNPNVAAVIVVGIEPHWTGRVVDGIAKTGKPVTGFWIEQNGDINTIAAASRKAKEYVQWASELPREACDISDLWISTKCGESDTTTGLASCPTIGNMYDKLIPQGIYGIFGETSEITGGEHIAKARAATPEVAEKWYAMWKAYQDEVIEAHKTDDLSDSQPTKGNIEGGLTTIEEKALGNLEKIGRTCRYIDALEPAEAPAKGPGLYYMDTSSAAAECVTLMAAAGEPDIANKLLEGYDAGGKTFKVHLDGYDQHDLLAGGPDKRHAFFYWTDDGDLAGLRYDQWKVVFLEQQAEGIHVWQQPLIPLRAPLLFNLRTDPFERADHESGEYEKWYVERMFVMAPAQAIVARELQTFKDFPPRQKPGSFSVGDAMDKLLNAEHSSN